MRKTLNETSFTNFYVSKFRAKYEWKAKYLFAKEMKNISMLSLNNIADRLSLEIDRNDTGTRHCVMPKVGRVKVIKVHRFYQPSKTIKLAPVSALHPSYHQCLYPPPMVLLIRQRIPFQYAINRLMLQFDFPPLQPPVHRAPA